MYRELSQPPKELIEEGTRELCKPLHSHSTPFWSALRAQVANTWPSTLFYLLGTLFLPRSTKLSLNCYGVVTFIALKLHSALWRQPRGWCGPRWKRVWYGCLRGRCLRQVERQLRWFWSPPNRQPVWPGYEHHLGARQKWKIPPFLGLKLSR